MQSTATTSATTEAYQEFLKVGKTLAPRTLHNYEEAIRLFLRDMSIPDVNALLSLPSIAAEDTIKAYFAKVSRPRADDCMKAVRLFYEANRMSKLIDWGHVRRFKPVRPDIAPTDRPYVKDEIKTLTVAAPNPRVKLAIMTMATGGLRVGALPGVFVKDLTWLEAHKLFAVMVYSGTKA